MTTKLSLRQLKKAKEFFKENPDGQIKVDWCSTWNKYSFDRFFITCLHKKINRNNRLAGKRENKDYADNYRLLIARYRLGQEKGKSIHLGSILDKKVYYKMLRMRLERAQTDIYETF
jgi:hypothetical protein